MSWSFGIRQAVYFSFCRGFFFWQVACRCGRAWVGSMFSKKGLCALTLAGAKALAVRLNCQGAFCLCLVSVLVIWWDLSFVVFLQNGSRLPKKQRQVSSSWNFHRWKAIWMPALDFNIAIIFVSDFISFSASWPRAISSFAAMPRTCRGRSEQDTRASVGPKGGSRSRSLATRGVWLLCSFSLIWTWAFCMF